MWRPIGSTRNGMPFTTRRTPRSDIVATIMESRSRRSARTTADMRSPLPREDDPDVGAVVERATIVVAEHRVDLEAGALQPSAHRRDRDGAEGQREVL